MQQQFHSYGIGSGQFHFLMYLYKKQGITQETLAEELQLDKGTCARAIQKLEDLGYVTRTRDQEDKRCYNIYLTKKAEHLKPTALKILKEWTNHLLNGFSDPEKDQLFSFLERLANNATLPQS